MELIHTRTYSQIENVRALIAVLNTIDPEQEISVNDAGNLTVDEYPQ